MANITINIKNCGCGGSTSARSPSTENPFPEGEWADPTNPAGPPEGYSEPISGLSDRQCKVSIWMYDWLHANLEFVATTTTGYTILMASRLAKQVGITSGLQRAIAFVIPTIISLLNGPDPSDALVAWLSWIIAGAWVSTMAEIETDLITQPLFQNTLDQIEPYQDEIICQISKATDAFSAYQAFENTIEAIDGLTFEQKKIAVGMLPRKFFNMLFYTSDYWPSFDDDYLANITATCCGDYVDGEPITAGSAQACASATFIVDQLIALFKSTGETGHTIWSDFNPFDSLKQDYRDYLEVNLTGYPKIKAAANWNGFLNALTEHVYLNRGYFFQLADVQTLWEYYDDTGLFATDDNLSARLLARRPEAINALFTAADKAAAYTALDAILETEIDLINTDDQIKTYMKSAIEALINPNQSTLLELLFTQDADLFGYPGDCGPTLSEPPSDGVIWYPVGVNYCYPETTGNCDNGDGQPDDLYTDNIKTGYHQVQFFPVTIGPSTTVHAWYKTMTTTYGNLYVDALIDGEWIRVRTSNYQSSVNGKWEGAGLGAYEGQTLSGLRFGFSSSVNNHQFGVGGYRIQNYIVGA